MKSVASDTTRRVMGVLLAFVSPAHLALGSSPENDAVRKTATNRKAKPLKLEILRSFPETVGGQQGIATDGKHVYVQATLYLSKYDMTGKLLAKSAKARWHHGGICHHDGKIYAAVSECAKAGTRKHWVFVYDAKTLERLAEHDVGAKFEVCAGGIAYYDGHFYVAESYWDNDHDDYVVQFDAEFKPVRSFKIGFKCPYGIQGLDYLPSTKRFVVNSHGKDFYLIDPSLDSKTIQPGRAPFELQDVAYLNPTTVVVNDRDGKRVVFARIAE
ncbi:MAG: hypothetical protein JXQ73_14945 [Phycisphaerae bacterium]|nr:hypothetical protein [Phycisphaerae bacterium]